MSYYNLQGGPPQEYGPYLGYVTRERAEKRSVRQAVSRVSLVAMCLVVISLLGSTALLFLTLALGQRDVYSLPPALYYMFMNLMTVLGTLLPFAVYFFVTRSAMPNRLRFEKVSFGTGALFVVAGLGVCMAGNIPASWIKDFLGSLGFPEGASYLPTEGGPLVAVLMFITIAVIPAVFEEFAFRGVLLSSLRKYGDTFAIVCSSLLFAFVHLSFSGTPFAFIAGLAMGFIYVRTGNLWLSILVHFLNNGISVIDTLGFAYVGESWGAFSISLIIVPMLLGVVALIVLGITKQFKYRAETPVVGLSSGQKAACVVSNPGFIIVATVFVAFSLLTVFGV